MGKRKSKEEVKLRINDYLNQHESYLEDGYYVDAAKLRDLILELKWTLGDYDGN